VDRTLARFTSMRFAALLAVAGLLGVGLRPGMARAQSSSTQDTQETTTPRFSFDRPGAGWKWSSRLALLYDSFGQRYEIADEDTLDLVDEMSSNLVLQLDRTGRTAVELRNTFGVGEEALRNDFFGALRREWKRFDLRLEEDFRYKNYNENTAFTLSSTYWVSRSRARLRWSLNEAWRLAVDERWEFTDVQDRTRYNYDYRRSDHGLEVERNFGFFSSLRAGYLYGTRSVPDSTVIDYERHALTFSWLQELGRHTLSMDHIVERRFYGDPDVRSHYRDWQGNAAMTLILGDHLRLRPLYRIWWVRYDQADSVFADADEHSLEMLLEGDLGPHTSLGVGPRAELRRTQSSFERSYDQLGLKGTVSVFAGSRFWMQFTNELGVRKHLDRESDDSDFFTDYIFNWTTLYLSWRFMQSASLDTFLSLNPESHEDAANNTVTLLFSGSLTWHLR
jgi:hypothetical protein